MPRAAPIGSSVSLGAWQLERYAQEVRKIPVEIIGELRTSDKFMWLQHCLADLRSINRSSLNVKFERHSPSATHLWLLTTMTHHPAPPSKAVISAILGRNCLTFRRFPYWPSGVLQFYPHYDPETRPSSGEISLSTSSEMMWPIRMWHS